LRLRNLPIWEKLAFLCGILLFSLCIVGLAGDHGILRLSEYNEKSQMYLAAVRNVAQVGMLHDGVRSVVFRSILLAGGEDKTEQQANLAELQETASTFRTYFEELNMFSLQGETKNALSLMRPVIDEYLAQAENIVNLSMAGQQANARLEVPLFQERFQRLRESLMILGIQIGVEANRIKELGRQAGISASRLAFSAFLSAIIVALVLGFIITRAILKPMAKITTAATRIAQGDIEQQIDHHAGDETGALATAFRDLIQYIREISDAADVISKGDLTVQLLPRSDHDVLSRSFVRMVKNLRAMNTKMQDGIQVLTVAIEQILESMQQVTTSTAETAAAVEQTAVTVDTVKQTAHTSNRTAREVSNNGRQMAEVSKVGALSALEAISGLSYVREQMESIAHSVVHLGEQSLAIGSLITTVNELAEQSNILAINAAIEAAKAGEAGAGFAVVAQEVRSLSERSKQATAQIQAILRDIQQATSVAIRVTEQATEFVTTGEQQSVEASKSIRALSESIANSAQAVTVIASSSQQQLMGMDQVAVAMESIKTASSHNVKGIRQVGSAAQNLRRVGQTLKELVEQYKLTSNNGSTALSVAAPLEMPAKE